MRTLVTLPPLMKPVVQCCTEVKRKDEGGQAQCVALLIVPILTMSHFGFLFFFQLAELTLFFFAACRSRHIAGTGHANEDIRALLIIGDSNPFKSGGRTSSSTVAWYCSTIVCLPIPRTLGISVGLYGSHDRSLSPLFPDSSTSRGHNTRRPHSWSLTGAFSETHWPQSD